MYKGNSGIPNQSTVLANKDWISVAKTVQPIVAAIQEAWSARISRDITIRGSNCVCTVATVREF